MNTKSTTYLNLIIKSIGLLILLINMIGFAQEPFVRKISFLEGLPTQVIYDTYVANNGMLYLGTDKGLISFDGVRFKEYPFDDNLGLAVNSIQEDSNGTIWCKNFANQVFFLKNNILQINKAANEVLSRDLNNLVDFLVIGEKLWLLTEKKLLLLREGKNPKIIQQFKVYNESDMFSAIAYNSKNKKLYLASLEHIFVLKANGILEKYPSAHGQKELTVYKDEVFFNIKGKKNEIWNLNGEKFKANLPDENTYFIKTSVTANDFWLCTSDGLYELNVQKKQTEKGFLRGKRITDISQDKEQNIWVSTLNEGLYFIPYKGLQKLNVDLSTSKSQLNFNCINRNKNGHIFVGTSNGKIVEFNKNNQQVFVYDSKTDMEVEHIYFYEDKIISSVGVFKLNDPNMLFSGYLGKNIVEDNSGNFLLASYNAAGLFSKSFKGKPSIPKQLKQRETNDFNSGQFQIYLFRNKRARSVYFCGENNLYYIGYSDGLYVYGAKEKVTEIKTKEGKPIIASRIISDAKGAVWVASTQQGLLKIKNAVVEQRFSVKEGLSSNHCKRIGIDDKGIWITTDNGLDFLAHEDQKPRNVGLNLALKGISINDIVIAEKSIYLATSEGVVFTNKTVFETKTIPNFKLSKIIVNNTFVSDSITLSYDQNNIEFQFQTIHYKSLGNYSYEFRIKEIDSAWTTQSSDETKVNYLALQPGNYTFEVRVRTADVITPIQTRFFSIEKPFWLRNWFLLLVFLCLLSLIFLVFKWATIRTQKKQEVKEQLALSQLTALRSQMNPHFMFNVLNAVQGLIYSNQKSRANEYLGTFSDLMRKTLDVSDKREISIHEELETIKLYIELEKARFEGDNFEYEIAVPSYFDLHQFVIPSLIVQPFVENAIKHGLIHKKGNKKLTLKIAQEDGFYWRFEIEDNGVGRKQATAINAMMKKHQSFATKAIASRIELINKLSEHPISIEILDVENENISSGTKVILHIPVKEKEI